MFYPNPPEFTERGIKPMPSGVPELPKPAQTRALARLIQRKGISDPAGTIVYEPDEQASMDMARPWLYPEQVAPQFERPQVKHVDAGELFLVRGNIIIPRVIPSPLNSRARAKLHIPGPGADGRVAVPWGPTDLGADPACSHRLEFQARDASELAAAARETATVVEGMQAPLAEMIGREGIEEDVLLVSGRWELDAGVLENSTTAVAVDGGSRLTLSDAELARAISNLLDNDSSITAKRREGLARLRDALDGRLSGLLINDINAERDLRDELERLLGEPAERLLRTKGFRAPRLLTAPAALVVAFRPYGSATILEAVQQLIGNLHKRGPKQWEKASQASDTRDEVVRALRQSGDITEAEMYLLGPRYQEAVEHYGKPSEPDYRIGEIIRLWYGNGPRTTAARRATRQVMRKGQLRKQALAPVLTAAILEQHPDTSPARESVQTALNDLFANPPVATDTGFPAHVLDPAQLLADAEHELAAGARGDACGELAAKGGVAMALLGALDRPYEASKEDRPYAVLERMTDDPKGRKMLAQAITDLRAGATSLVRLREDGEPAGHLGTGQPEAWTGNEVRASFPTAHQAVAVSSPTETDLIRRITTAIESPGGIRSLLEELEQVPAVKRTGLTRTLGEDSKQALDHVSGRLAYLMAKHDDYFSSGPIRPDEGGTELLDEPDSDTDDDEIDEPADEGDELSIEQTAA